MKRQILGQMNNFSILIVVFLLQLGVAASVLAQNPDMSSWIKNISESSAETESKCFDHASEIVAVGSTIHVLWITDECDDAGSTIAKNIYYRRSIDNGVTWQPKQLIYNGDLWLIIDPTYKRMVVEGNYVHVAVSDYGGDWYGKLEYIRSTDNGTTFELPRTIFTAATYWHVYNTYITASNGKVSIGFRNQCNWEVNNQFLLLNSDDHGLTFSQSTIYTTDTGSSWNVHDLQRDGDTICGLYTDAYYTYGQVYTNLYIACSDNAGQSFSSTLISVPSVDGNHKANPQLQDYHYVPKIAINGNTVSVIWTGLVSDGLASPSDIRSVFLSHSTNSGLTFDAPINLTQSVLPDTTVFQAGQETLAVAGNYVYTIFVSTGGNVYLRRSSDGGSNFFGLQELTAIGQNNISSGWWPIIATDPTDPTGEKVYLLWNTPTYCFSANGGVTFSKPVLVSPEYSYGGSMTSRTNRPAMAIGADGKIHYAVEGRYYLDEYYDFDILYRGLTSQQTPSTSQKALLLYSNREEGRYDNLQIPASPYLNFTSKLTAEVWVKPSAGGNTTGYTDTQKPIFFKMQDTMGKFAYSIGTYDRYDNRQVIANITTTDGSYSASPTNATDGLVPDNVWTHLAITYDAAGGSDNLKLYMNGQLIHSATATGNLLTSDGQFFMGYYGIWEIDELRLWDVVRSQAQIAGNMTTPMLGTEPGLSASYNLNDTAKDITGHGNDGVLMYKEVYVDSDCFQEISLDSNITNGYAPLEISFSCTVDFGNPPYAFLWNFDDGSTDNTDQNPSHTYENAGEYAATCTVTDDSGQTITGIVNIQIFDLSEEIQSWLVLTDNSDPLTLSFGDYAQVFGSTDINIINMEAGARVQCLNFIGSNQINIEENSSEFTVYRSGAMVYLKTSTGTLIKIPATQTGQTLRFADGSSELVIADGEVMLGNQIISMTESVVDSPVNGADTSTDIF